LSHIFARTCDLYTWLPAGLQLCLARSRDTVLDDCQWAQPTVLSGVPYFFDRVARVLREQGLDRQPDGLRRLLGGRIKFCGSGGAALPDHLFDLYQRFGVPILQGYGLTESSPVISVSRPDAFRRGASGQALTGVEVRIAEDGEIVTRGPHVMQGYWRDEAATADVVVDGWLHTGDLGRIDEDGFVYITGRKKELIVTAAGKNVAPVLLESLLTEDPLIDQALVVGDGRNYLAALIVPNWDAVRAELPELAAAGPAELRGSAEVVALFQRQIDQRLACVSYHEQVRKFTLLTRPFLLEQHEMTPKLSLRRPIIHEHFRAEIEGMYGK
jgi:long-chain acyl-CoA synthetase